MTAAILHITKFVGLLYDSDRTKCIEYINKYNDFYDTPLSGWSSIMYATLYRRTDVIKELILKGVNINNKTPIGETALYIACLYNSDGIAITLIDAGADFVDTIDTGILDHYSPRISQYIRNIYQQQIISVVNAERTDSMDNNALATSFRTTYVPGVIDMISEFII
ncbi:MAG: hypothetical protein Faunusvirus35_3 [Faunusvirus sp.]|jgi:ankyrin repeat protein|uniref:Uncharacterized protein n=1 Tax=Faunusvirus sp. TaxID=2487766 RepID=A0A3G4ZZE0_9VIRU|nr:MAG: hypothetical protein Faunusvirus35_3 [Faunusvirus sp.]